MRVFPALALVIAVPLAGGTLKPVEVSKFWVESGLNKQLVLQEISNAKCNSTPEYLKSCQQAADAAKKQLSVPVVLPTDDFDALIDLVDCSKDLKEPKEQIYGEMINAHLRAFDAHAFFLPATAVKQMLGSESGSHYGTGVRVIATAAGLMVREVLPDTPAKAAGVQVNDRLLEINGQAVKSGFDSRESIDLIAGKEGDPMDFVVDRNGTQHEIKMQISVIADPVVTEDIYKIGKAYYGYVRLFQFRQDSCVDVKEKIEKMAGKIKGLILDLRNNPGGELDEGVCLAGLFVGKKNVVGVKSIPIRIPVAVSSPFQDPDIDWMQNYRDAEFDKLPLTVLIDAGSASASEIVAAALQDHQAAYAVGEKSFGKGTVQTLQDFPGNSIFKIAYTDAIFYRPSGQANQLVGVTPDFDIPFRRGATDAERQSPREPDLFPNTLKAQGDPQPVQEPRPEVADLNDCATAKHRDLSNLKLVTRKLGYADYQRAYALSVLECEIQSQHNTSLAERIAPKSPAD